ncbi:MAG: PPC domain-containing protein [Candidatus Thermoplasmatota archaeon]|nr:PPC domain-containing protein [Candidatus Thermoplasmatota archaeon]
MYNKRDSKKSRIEAVVIALLIIGTALIVPVSTIASNTNNPVEDKYYSEDDDQAFILDRSYYLMEENPASMNTEDNDDAGCKKDAGRDQNRATPLYPGELIDDTPGRGRTGKLSSSDTDDWYYFSACIGQQIIFTVTPPSGFDIDISLWDKDKVMITSSNTSGSAAETITYTATYSGKWYMWLKYVSGSGTEQYTFNVTMNGQNDANTMADAPNTRASALLLTPGSYFGYLDRSDPYDWYKIQVTAGQGIHVTLLMEDLVYLTDFDLQLYDPSGTLVYEGNQYYGDEFNYPADVTGQWSIRVDIFPGWVDCPKPTEWKYYSYGAGPYNLILALESSGSVPGPIPQPQIIPIAKTFKVANDPASTADDFAYLAAIPACNYLAGGQRYLAPILYTGDTTPTAYYDEPTEFDTVDDMTQYLVDDWNDYLDLFGKMPVEYTVPADPIEAAAEIATNGWTSSDTAVVAVDGSSFEDATKNIVKTATLKRVVDVDVVENDDPKLQSEFGYMQLLGPKWCAISVNTTGITTTSGSASGAVLTQVFPTFMDVGYDDWPVPYDGTGWAGDIYYPVTRVGFWSALSTLSNYSYDKITVTKYAGDRYRFRVSADDAVITSVLTTDSPSDLVVFLVDPQGYLRAPITPVWNGPVNPIHEWNGFENPAVNPWRTWNPAPHTEFTAEVLHPQKGIWTAIVVPRNAEGANVKYTLTTTIRTVSADRADATISAANAAVIASMNHFPLLYVTKDSVPAATQSAFTTLGVTKVIFVERNSIGDGVRSKLPTVEKDLKTMQEIVDEIKSYDTSENYVAATSLKTGDGYFAPTAMLAAYHGAPVIRVEDAPDGDPAAVAERIVAWARWAGDYYHGSRANGHLPHHTAPVEQQTKFQLLITFIKFLLNGNASILPPLGLDAKRYWNEEMHNYFDNYIESLGLNLDGQEAYAIVAPRSDINMVLHSALTGNNSYAGQIPGITPAYSSNMVVRSVLYPALIFANPNRNTTTCSMINYPEANSFTLNDGKSYKAYSSRVVKDSFSSHLRSYYGHTFWRAHLERMNDGASVYYYSGHGTGGSGMSEMYEQTEHSNYPDQVWWDAWRGYLYDSWRTAREVISGNIWFNPEPPMLYDIIHYKWVDQQYQNLKSNAIFYMSCTTGDGDGPLVFLEHGAVMWYGNANTGLCPEADIGDDEVFKLTLIYGEPVGVAWSKQVWLHYRDFTTGDNTSMYGPSSMYPISSIQVIYGDPNLIIYSPEWQAPTPIDA